ncbi:MAG: hypothetical protein ACTHN3_13350 [Solirubrobacterales bacterium]
MRLFVGHSFSDNDHSTGVAAFRQAVKDAVSSVNVSISQRWPDLGIRIDPVFEDRQIGRLLPLQVRRQLAMADIVLIDGSGLSPNVFYELGYAHGMRRPLLFTYCGESVDDVPRDVADFIVGTYTDTDSLQDQVASSLQSKLDELLSDGSTAYEPRERCFWFDTDCREIHVICAPEPEMSRFADVDAENYLFIDSLEDRDALMELAMFLSRALPRTQIVRHSSSTITPDVLSSDIVVLGGPMNNHVTRDLMRALEIPLTFDLVKERMCLGEGAQFQLASEGGRPSRDAGYFGRFRNPFDRSHHVVLCQGFYTFGTLAAAGILADSSQAVRNTRHLEDLVSPRRLPELDSLQIAFPVEILANRRILVPDIHTATVLYS